MAYVGEDRYDDPGPAIVSRYVTYARTQLLGTSARADCPPRSACRPLAYVNTHNIYCDADSTMRWFALAQQRPSWWLHALGPSDSVLTAWTRYGHCPSGAAATDNTYYANLTDDGNLAYWQGQLAAKAAAAQAHQCFFLDDVPYYLNRPSREIRTSQALFAAEGREFAAYAPFCLWTNGLGPGGGFYRGGVTTLGGAVRGAVPIDAYTRYRHSSNVLGVTFEQPLWAPSDRLVHAENLPVMINTISRLLAETNLRIAVLDFSADSGGVSLDRVRRLHTAALWMVSGNSLEKIVSWLEPRTSAPHRPLGIYPEQLVVPTKPIKALRPWAPSAQADGTGCSPLAPDGSEGGMADLLLSCGLSAGKSAGLYVREYRACYAAGTPVGGCAALINLQDRPVTVDSGRLALTYTRTLSWTGGPLHGACISQDGCNGVLLLTKRSPETRLTVPAEDALLLVK